MKQYSFKFKMKVVKEYLDGRGGYTSIARKYKVDRTQINEWVNRYNVMGEEGLKKSRQNRKHTLQNKLTAINLYLTSELSIAEVSNITGVMNPSYVSAWIRTFKEQGIQGFTGAKKGEEKMKKYAAALKNIDNSVCGNDIISQQRIKELDREVYLGRMENDYLKALRSLEEKKVKNFQTKKK